MLLFFFLLTATITAALYGYTGAFQAATLYWGQRLGTGNELLPSTGLQDALTPPAQTYRVYAVFCGLVPTTLIVAFIALPRYAALPAIVATYVAGIVVKMCFPSPDASFFYQRIHRSLVARRTGYKVAGDDLRADAMSYFIDKFDLIAPGRDELTPSQPQRTIPTPGRG